MRLEEATVMGMKIKEFMNLFESFAPLSLAEGWDKVGLQVGSKDGEFKRVMLTIDMTEGVAAEAVRRKCGLVLAYHPVIFEALKDLTDGEAKTRALLALVRAGAGVFVPHTALDACAGGINDWLAEGVSGVAFEDFEKKGVKCDPIKPVKGGDGGLYKVIVFVPVKDVERVRDAMSGAGAGRLGNYEKCSFETRGTGTFQGNAQSNPVIGTAGVFERVEEVRLEMIAMSGVLSGVIAAMRKAHPYEEPAFDVFKEDASAVKTSHVKIGQGRIVELPKAISMEVLLKRVKKHLGVKGLEVSVGAMKKKVKRVGVCAGAGASLLKDAGKVDVFLTGEMRHHDQMDAAGRGVAVVLAGHTQTERGYLRVLKLRLDKMLKGLGVEVVVSEVDGEPMEER
jgi:dinuclear metal center YbgI/SA1388 family protein